GIRDKLVTGVQTCALPILGVANVASDTASAPDRRRKWTSPSWEDQMSRKATTPPPRRSLAFAATSGRRTVNVSSTQELRSLTTRSEERRVGKECRAERWA